MILWYNITYIYWVTNEDMKSVRVVLANFCLIKTVVILDYLVIVSIHLNFDRAIVENIDGRILIDFSLRTREALVLERYFWDIVGRKICDCFQTIVVSPLRAFIPFIKNLSGATAFSDRKVCLLCIVAIFLPCRGQHDGQDDGVQERWSIGLDILSFAIAPVQATTIHLPHYRGSVSRTLGLSLEDRGK